MTVYVQRDGTGAVVGVYALAQPGYADEPVDDADPSVLAYFAALAAMPTTAQQRADAQAAFQTGASHIGRGMRALASVVLARVNATDQCLANLFAAIASATSLADLKARAAAINVPPQFTLADVKQAVVNAINSTDSD